MQVVDVRRAHGLTALRPPGRVAVRSGQVHRLLLRGLEPVRAVFAVERAAGALEQFGEEAEDDPDALRLRFDTDQDGSFARTATIDRLDLAQSRLPILPIGPHIRVDDV